VLSHGAFHCRGLFGLSGGFSGVRRRSEGRDGCDGLRLVFVGFGFFLLAISSGHLSLLLRRLVSTPNDTSFMSCQVCLFGFGRIYQAQLGVAFTHAEGN